MNRKVLFSTLCVVTALIFLGCFSNPADSSSALSPDSRIVTFRSIGGQKVVYSNNQIVFIIDLQASDGQNKTVDFQITDGASLVSQGSRKTSLNGDGGIGLFWVSDTVKISIIPSNYTGKDLTVTLDPSNKVASYTLNKAATVRIP